MINDEIEEIDMKPFIESLKGIDINNKPLVLFGSCGWRETTFIDKWQEQMKEFGFNVIGKIVVRDSVEKKDIQRSKELGKLLAQV